MGARLKDKYVSWLTLAHTSVAHEQPLTFPLVFLLLRGSREAVGQLREREGGVGASTEHRAQDNCSLIKPMWRQVGVVPNEG